MKELNVLPYILVFVSAFITLVGGLINRISLLLIVKRLVILGVWFYLVGAIVVRLLKPEGRTGSSRWAGKGTHIDISVYSQQDLQGQQDEEDSFEEMKPPAIDSTDIDVRGRIRGGR